MHNDAPKHWIWEWVNRLVWDSARNPEKTARLSAGYPILDDAVIIRDGG